MKIGFIGLGLIGARRARIAMSAGYQIGFMVDPDPKRLEIAPPDCVTAPSLKSLEALGGDQADVVMIAVPHDLALSACQWAFARGAHVLCEKPMGLALEQAEIIAAEAEKAGRHFCAGFNYRYLPGVSALRELLRKGDLGQLYRLRLAMGHGGRPGMETEWKVKRSRAGGGAIIDPGIHLIDLALYLAGPETLQHVAMSRRFWETDIEDNCAMALRAESGADVNLEVSLTAWKNFFVIEAYGSDGMAILNGRAGNYGTQKLEYVNRWFWNGDDRRVTKDLGLDDPSFELETRAFLDLVTTGCSDGILSSEKDGCAALAIVRSAYAMAKSQK